MNYISQQNLPDSLNAYRISMGILFNRIKWDLNLKSWKSKKYFSQNHTKYNGKKAIILCNGPSLNSVDFKLLKEKNIYTIGLNKINLLFENTDFRPNLIVAINKLVIEQNIEFYKNTDIELILDSSCANLFNSKKMNIHFVHSLPLQLKFARNIKESICQGYTVTYVALQIAYHLGFSEVALVGCDHNFTTKGSSNMTVRAEDKDPNHFSPNYFSNGVKWQLPDLLGSELHYKLANEYYESNNRKIYNATDGGKLEIFERKTLIDYINE
ncbi:MAG: DUF115 domain-containing protein [Flavobacteriia bacterium]|nr:DUF115 domain-containing protein [Flavobacteriia bacterium]